MDKVSKRKVCTVSVTIQWCEDDAMAVCEQGRAPLATAAKSQQHPEGVAEGKAPHNTSATSTRPSSKRLLPSDRIVLSALRQRVTQGKRVTTLVRIRELEVECEISRRQVQICIKRLSERGLIKRLIEGTGLAGTSGYRYHLSKDALRG
jgi:hypothetical protein